MKILYITDPHEHHENQRRIESYRRDSKPDLFVMSGDILDAGKVTQDQAFALAYLDHLRSYGTPPRRFSKKGILYYLNLNFDEKDFSYPEEYIRILPKVAEFMAKSQKGTSYTKRLAEDYLKTLQEIDKGFRKRYRELEKILGAKPLIIPGNYDIDLDKINEKRNLHQKVKKVKGFKIAGYGSANFPWGGRELVPPTIPVELTIPYLEIIDKKGELLNSEPKKFFLKTKPDIAFIHMPLLGYGDHTKNNNFAGGKGILEYAKTGLTKVLVCGHIHEDIIVERVRGTENREPVVLVNPGALVDGRFAEITMNDETGKLEEIALCTITGTENNPKYHLLNNVIIEKKYFLTPDGELSELIMGKPVY